MCFESGSLCPLNAKLCCYAITYGRVVLEITHRFRIVFPSHDATRPVNTRHRQGCAHSLSSSPRREYGNPLLDAGTRLLDQEIEVETEVVSLITCSCHASSVARIDPVPDLDNRTGDALVVIDVETTRCPVCRP
jgi:hypothetical protein